MLDEALKTSSNLVEDSKKETLRLYNCYQTSDIPCLETMVETKENGGSLEGWQYDLLLKQRNINWIPKIEGSINKGQTFIAVGVGHLIGQDSVLELLKIRGFNISPVY